MINNLEKVSILVRTFLRDHKLFSALYGIKRRLPEVKIIIVDDGEMTEEKDSVYAEMIRDGHNVILMGFDSGLSAKSNVGVRACSTPYLLMGSDDFDFDTPKARYGIELMTMILEEHPGLDIAAGRVDNHPYEYKLDIGNTGVIEEKPIANVSSDNLIFVPDYIPCDVTKNYWLARRKVFNKVRWDDDPACRIGGGEHGAFFYDLKKNSLNLGYVPNANINAQDTEDTPRYNRMRRRACSPDRPCFKRRGIKKYILASGEVDFEETR